MKNSHGQLRLQDGSTFEGRPFGYSKTVAGELAFNTGMVGYPEALTDPSYRGQILVLTYPLVGNYGVPSSGELDGIDTSFESGQVQVAGLIVSEASLESHHWNATRPLSQWLDEQGVPALSGIDTRALTKRLREKGSMLGTLSTEGQDIAFHDPNKENLVSSVSIPGPVVYSKGTKRVVVIDCGCKNSIIRNLLSRDVTVIRVPWNYDFHREQFDGVLISNGPGDPKMCLETIAHIRKAMERALPVFGVCLGHQILALAAGADTFKMKFGHRSQNQPCIETGTKRCFITSQNHGYAVDVKSLPDSWVPWFTNANDGTNEGIRHLRRPFFSVQFHPEAAPGPQDTNFRFDDFVGLL